jgi:hypothetical protein
MSRGRIWISFLPEGARSCRLHALIRRGNGESVRPTLALVGQKSSATGLSVPVRYLATVTGSTETLSPDDVDPRYLSRE